MVVLVHNGTHVQIIDNIANCSEHIITDCWVHFVRGLGAHPVLIVLQVYGQICKRFLMCEEPHRGKESPLLGAVGTTRR